jgi:hypothetical protein
MNDAQRLVRPAGFFIKVLQRPPLSGLSGVNDTKFWRP